MKSHLMRNFTSLFSIKDFNKLASLLFAIILFGIGSLTAQTIDQTKPVGATAGSANSTASGGATYTIPIEVPFGSNGVQPNLSLVYNSQSGDGIAGFGWNISAYSVISRAGKNVFHNGTATPVNYTNSNDAFMLDGQRLFAITGANGADGTVYGTEAEGFSKIESFGGSEKLGPDWFKVTAKNGTIMEFGRDPYAKLVTDYAESTMVWFLNKVTDKNGNYSLFKYNIDNTGRRYALKEIDYTGNERQGLLPYNKVQLFYNDRNNWNTYTTYDAGASITNAYNLDKITITNEAGIVVKTYQCIYGLVKNDYFLTSIQETGSDGTALNPTFFSYGANIAASDVTVSGRFGSATTSVPDTYAGDFNGDGKQDLLKATFYTDNDNIRHYSQYQIVGNDVSVPVPTVYSTYTFPSNEATAEVIATRDGLNSFSTFDYDNDGKQDVLMTKTGTELVGNITYHTYKGIRINYSRIGNDASLIYSSTSYDNIPTLAQYSHPFTIIHPSNNYFIPGDFDGDGSQDYILILAYNLGDAYKAFFSSPTKNISNEEIAGFGVGGDPTNPFYASSVAGAQRLIPIDFDGDGKTEILVVKENQSYILSVSPVSAATGYSYAATVLGSTAAVTGDNAIYPGDFNGDKKTDLLVSEDATDIAGFWHILYSTGKVFNKTSFVFYRAPYRDYFNAYGVMVGDLNNDGRTDIWHSLDVLDYTTHTIKSAHKAYYSNGQSFTSDNETIINVSVNSDYTSQDVTGDFNGDGKPDMLTMYNGSSLSIFPRPYKEERLLTKIKNGLGAEINFSYDLLTNSNVYTRSSPELNGNPYSVITTPLYVLAGQNAPNGIGGTSNVFYTYQDAVVHKQGRGFLGFKKNIVYDATSGNTTTTENDINTQFSVPFTLKQYTVNGTVTISENRFTNSFVALGGTNYFDKRYTQRVDKVLSIDGLKDAATETTNTYDNYGNITNIVKNIGSWDGTTVTPIETETTTTTYGIHNTPVPALPEYLTAKRVRPTHVEVIKNTKFLYSAEGNVTTQIEFDGATYPVTTTYEYDLFGNSTKKVVTSSSAAGSDYREFQSQFDDQGRFTTFKFQLDRNHTISKTEVFAYDTKWGKPLTITSNKNLITSYEYDGFGRLTKTTLPEGYAITQKLSWENTEGIYSLSSTQPGGGPDVKIWYDILGREVKRQTLGFGNVWLIQNTVYDSRGNVVSQTKPYYSGETPITTTTQYDQYNRVTQISNTASTTSYTYTKLSGSLFKVTTTNGAGQSSSKTQDASGRIKNANDNGGQLNYSYDSWGNQLSVGYGGKTIYYKYDEYGRQTSLQDLNANTTTYVYNGFGQLIKQTDALNKTCTLEYDDFGHMTKRVGSEGTTTYGYDRLPSSNRIQDDLQKVVGFAGEITNYVYDNLRRPIQQKVTVDGTEYLKQFAYDTYGNLIKTTYPSGVIVNDTYDRNGTLTQTTLTDAGITTTLFTANAINSAGIYTGYSYGNGKTSQVDYNSILGMPTRYYTPGIQDLNFDFNAQTGNLNFRKDAIKNLTETFTYDNLNRLTGSTVNNMQQLALSYDAASGTSRGNIMSKTDAGNYVYKTDKINAVAYVTNPAGAQTQPAVISTLPQLITYTPFQKTASVDQNGYHLDYTYSEDMERIKSVMKQNGAVVETKYYFGAMEVQTQAGITRYIHYIKAGNGLCAIAVKESGVTKVYYAYSDYLGSILTLTDNTGAIVAKQNFDAWGRYRNPDDWTYNNMPTQPVWFYRGFTGHEHLKEFALINMNGRMYDPIQGRMLSPDNEVPLPWNTQGYNRYSYANNNPLVYVDPDGNFFFLAPIIVGAIFGGVMEGIHAESQGGSFLSGAWKGAITGAIGGAFSFIGGGTFVGNLAWGAGEGVLTNGVSNLLNGNPFFQGAGRAALWGAAFATATSDNMHNLFKGQGFRSNDEVLQRFISGGEYEDALDYFGMNADFNSSYLSEDGSAYRGYFDPSSKSIHLSELAFKYTTDGKASFDLLNSVYQKELWHQSRSLSGLAFTDVGDNWTQPFRNSQRAEDALGHAFQKKNLGAFSSVQRNSPNVFTLGLQDQMSRASMYARELFHPSIYTLFYKHGIEEFIYSIPRRFRNILSYYP